MARKKHVGPTEVEVVIAKELLAGKSASEACRVAGFSESTVRARSGEIVKRDGVRLALLEAERTMPRGEEAKLGRARLLELLTENWPASARDQISAIRLAIEAAGGIVNGGQHLHIHQATAQSDLTSEGQPRFNEEGQPIFGNLSTKMQLLMVGAYLDLLNKERNERHLRPIALLPPAVLDYLIRNNTLPPMDAEGAFDVDGVKVVPESHQ